MPLASIVIALTLNAPATARAHFGTGDSDDPLQEYGVLVFIAAVVLIGTAHPSLAQLIAYVGYFAIVVLAVMRPWVERESPGKSLASAAPRGADHVGGARHGAGVGGA